MDWESAALTDRGVRRATNEDAYLTRPALGVFAVADGMGGHAAGDVASRLAVDTVGREVDAGYHADRPAEEIADALRSAILQANDAILEQARLDPEKAGMGTTIAAVALLPREGVAVCAHIGDSRIYLRRGGELIQVTRDHTWVQDQIEAGSLSPERARAHPFANVLTRALGTDEEVEVETGSLAVAEGDLLLLCTDGLTTMLDDPEIGGLLDGTTDLDAAAERLVAEANRRGGLDNVTLVLLRVGGA